MDKLHKYIVNKQLIRKKEVALIQSGKLTALELLKLSFWKDANLKDARVSRTEFRIF